MDRNTRYDPRGIRGFRMGGYARSQPVWNTTPVQTGEEIAWLRGGGYGPKPGAGEWASWATPELFSGATPTETAGGPPDLKYQSYAPERGVPGLQEYLGLGSMGTSESPYGYGGIYGRDVSGIPTGPSPVGSGGGFFSYGTPGGPGAASAPMSFAYGGPVPDPSMVEPTGQEGLPDEELLMEALGGDQELMEVMSDPLFDDAVMAIQNPGIPGSEEAIQAFVDRFGEEALRLLEQAVASGKEESMPSPTDAIGELSQLAASQGQMPGDGMSDSIPGAIDGVEPVSLSSGEYVLPADVVAHAGNGDTNAGVRSIEGGIASLRNARTGNPEAPERVNPMGLFG